MRTGLGIAFAAGLQTLALVAMIGVQQYTLNEGTPVLLETEPIDPRSLFRGDFVILNYAISDLPRRLPGGELDWRRRDTAHVVLKPGEPYWRAVSIHRARPDVEPGQVAIKAEVTYVDVRSPRDPDAEESGEIELAIRVRYGIEAYFVPEGEGRAIERPADGETIDILAAVDRFGNAAVKSVLVNGQPLYEESLFR